MDEINENFSQPVQTTQLVTARTSRLAAASIALGILGFFSIGLTVIAGLVLGFLAGFLGLFSWPKGSLFYSV